VRLSRDSSTSVNFTTQLYFDETSNAAVLATAAYQKAQARDTTNAGDALYDAQNLVPATGNTTDGYTGAFTVNLDFGDGTSGTGTTTTSTAVAARLAWAKVVRRAGGRRVVQARLVNHEDVTVRYRLIRGDDVLAGRRYGWLVPGSRTLKLRVPRSVKAGHARVQLKLTDTDGNTRFASLPVHVPRR
jgi:hypothetical protein